MPSSHADALLICCPSRSHLPPASHPHPTSHDSICKMGLLSRPTGRPSGPLCEMFHENQQSLFHACACSVLEGPSCHLPCPWLLETIALRTVFPRPLVVS